MTMLNSGLKGLKHVFILYANKYHTNRLTIGQSKATLLKQK